MHILRVEKVVLYFFCPFGKPIRLIPLSTFCTVFCNGIYLLNIKCSANIKYLSLCYRNQLAQIIAID